LLRPIEAVQLVDKEDGALAGFFELVFGLIQQLAYFFDSGGNRVELPKVAMSMLSDDVGQRGLARPGRPIKDKRSESVGLQHAAEQFARPKEMFLPYEFIGSPRPHPRRQGLSPEQIGSVNFLEKVLR
jgi:hypothetical protein